MFIRLFDDGQISLKQIPDVLRLGPLSPAHGRLRPAGISQRSDALTIGDIDFPADLAHRRWVPACGNKTQRTTFTPTRDVEHSQAVVVGVGDVERFFVFRKRQAIGGATRRGVGKKRSRERLDDFAGG